MTAATTHESLLAHELAAVRGEQVRIDAKCSTLAGLAGAALVWLVAQVGDHHTPLITRLLLGSAGIDLTAAAVILLFGVLRPKLGSTGFNKYAQMSGEDIRRELIVDGVAHRRFLADELVVLSRITLAKQRRLRTATTLLTTGVVSIAAAMLASVIAGVIA